MIIAILLLFLIMELLTENMGFYSYDLQVYIS